MDRRSFLGSILAACAAPAIVRADSLMRIVPAESLVLTSSGLLPISEAAWVGAIRELKQFVSDPAGGPDHWIYRWDVVNGPMRAGWEQLGVDFSALGPTDYARATAPVMDALRGMAARKGFRPVRGILEIPDGVDGRYL